LYISGYKICDVRTNNDLEIIPKIERIELNILWVNDFYDIFISGIAQYQEKMFLFDLVDYDFIVTVSEKVRAKYWLIELDDEQLKEEIYWHDLFDRNVGSHFDFTNKYSPLAEVDANPDAFYIPYNKRIAPNYQNNRIIAWFQN
jgi:hypothetical protein